MLWNGCLGKIAVRQGRSMHVYEHEYEHESVMDCILGKAIGVALVGYYIKITSHVY